MSTTAAFNTTAAFEIVELALSLAKGKDAATAQTVVQIIGKAVQACQDQTGEPVDPSLIKAEDPV
jgi:hypothetical protein